MSSCSLLNNLTINKLSYINKSDNASNLNLSYIVKDIDNKPKYLLQEVIYENDNIYYDENIYYLSEFNTKNIDNSGLIFISYIETKNDDNKQIQVRFKIKLNDDKSSVLIFEGFLNNKAIKENHDNLNYYISESNQNLQELAITGKTGIFINFNIVKIIFTDNGIRNIYIS